MSRLSDNAKKALDETRMLILGVQVLIGFQFQAVFQATFAQLSPEAQRLGVCGLALMLIAAGLFIAPGAFHQIVESGEDTPELMAFTGRMAAFGLLPFGLGIGVMFYVVTQLVIGRELALVLGVLGTAFALAFWYGLQWIWRAYDSGHRIEHKEQRMAEPTPIDKKIEQVLTEARVVLPGAQALIGFQLTSMLMDEFSKLPKSSQYIHIFSLMLISAT